MATRKLKEDKGHIRGDVGRRSVTDSALGRRSRVRGSVVGPFSHVAILLSCVVSSEFKQLKEEYEKMKQGNSDYDAFPSRELQVAFGNIVTLRTLK